MPVVCSRLQTLSLPRPCLTDEEAGPGGVMLLVLRHSMQVASRIRFQHSLETMQTPTARSWFPAPRLAGWLAAVGPCPDCFLLGPCGTCSPLATGQQLAQSP